MKEKQIKSKVYTMYKEGRVVKSEDEQEEILGVVRLDPEVAYGNISTERSFTKGLPNYSSAKASVFVSVPAALNEEEMEKAYRFAADFCEAKVAEVIKEMGGGK